MDIFIRPEENESPKLEMVFTTEFATTFGLFNNKVHPVVSIIVNRINMRRNEISIVISNQMKIKPSQSPQSKTFLDESYCLVASILSSSLPHAATLLVSTTVTRFNSV